jgi:hypothetical protein
MIGQAMPARYESGSPGRHVKRVPPEDLRPGKPNWCNPQHLC